MTWCAPRPNRFCSLAMAAFLLGAAPTAATGDDIVRLGGTGMALAAMQQAGAAGRQVHPSLRLEVLPSLGTPGGLRALNEGAIDLAVVGRALTPAEKASGTHEATCLTTPLVFATSQLRATGVAKSDLPRIYAEPAPRWPDGQPLKVLLRSRAGSENAYLTAAIPGMAQALETAYKRSGVPIVTTDQENAELASRTVGSFAIMTLLQLRAERLTLRPLALDGVAASPETVANKSYPLAVEVCVVLPATPTPATAQFVAYLTSPAGQSLLQGLGTMPSR